MATDIFLVQDVSSATSMAHEVCPAPEGGLGEGPPADSRSSNAAIVRGGAALLTRQVLGYLVALSSSVALAHLLSVAAFGAYELLLLIIAFTDSVASLGLGVSLVQQAHRPTDGELAQCMSVQILVALPLVALCILVGPTFLNRVTDLPHVGMAAGLAAVAVAALAAKAVPTALLERDLRMGRIAGIEFGSLVVFNVTCVAGAALGFGVLSLALGLALQTSLTSALLWHSAGWKPRVTADMSGLGRRLAFAIPFQASTATSFAKDAMSPLVVGAVLGVTALGYVEWASSLASVTLLALLSLQRLFLPVFSRNAGVRARLSAVVDDAVLLSNAVAAPCAAIAVGVAGLAVPLVFGDRWTPALPLFYLFAVANLSVPTAIPLVSALNSLGRSSLTFGFAVMWMGLTWAVGLPLVLLLGRTGFALANVVVVTSNLLVFRAARRDIDFRLRRLWRPWLAAAAAGLLACAVCRLTLLGAGERLTLALLAGGGSYLLVSLRLQRETLALVLPALPGRRRQR